MNFADLKKSTTSLADFRVSMNPAKHKGARDMENEGKTIEEFCETWRICRATFYNIMKRGDGPAIMKIGNCTRISAPAETEWRRRMEAKSAQQAA